MGRGMLEWYSLIRRFFNADLHTLTATCLHSFAYIFVCPTHFFCLHSISYKTQSPTHLILTSLKAYKATANIFTSPTNEQLTQKILHFYAYYHQPTIISPLFNVLQFEADITFVLLHCISDFEKPTINSPSVLGVQDQI